MMTYGDTFEALKPTLARRQHPEKLTRSPKIFKHRKHANLQKPPFYERGIGATQKLVQIVDMNVGNNLYRMDFSISVTLGWYDFSNQTCDIEEKRP